MILPLLIFTYLFIFVILPGLEVFFLGIIFLVWLSGYVFYKFFIMAPIRAFVLWRDGKIEPSIVRIVKIWKRTTTYKEWFARCIKSDIETLKTIVNF
jgi:hypothetical protein